MKTKILTLICLAVLTAAGSFTYQHIYQNQVILLKDNQAVITKESWVVGDSIFYKTEDDTHSINMDLVADVKQRGIFNKGYGIVVILKHHLAPIGKRELKKQAPVMGVVIIGILFCIAIYFLLKKLAGAIKKRTIRVEDSKIPANNERVYEGQEQIAQFFLSVFKTQKGS